MWRWHAGQMVRWKGAFWTEILEHIELLIVLQTGPALVWLAFLR